MFIISVGVRGLISFCLLAPPPMEVNVWMGRGGGGVGGGALEGLPEIPPSC